MFFSKGGASSSARNSVALDVALDLAQGLKPEPEEGDQAN